MTHKLQTTLSRKMVMLFLAILSLTSVTLSSCTKKSDSNDAAKFVGTWNGTSSCGMTYITFAGSGTTVTTDGTVGSGTCQKSVTFTLTASGNAMSGSAVNTDLCGNTITSGMTGTISGNTLTLSITAASSTGSSGSCTFTGTK